MRDTKSMLLALLSFCMVGTWVYHLHDKIEYSKQPKVIYVKEKIPVKNSGPSVKDPVDSSRGDTADLSGDTSIQAMIKLRNEIAFILSDSHITRNDLSRAEEKINILQRKIAILSGKEKVIKEDSPDNRPSENKDEIKQKSPPPASEPSTQKNKFTEEQSNLRIASEKSPQINLASTFTATMISLRAIVENDPNQTVTMVADETDHLSISFCVKNKNTSFKSTPVYIVVLDPEGNVIEDDAWEAGIMNTSNEGSIRYTRKLTLEYNRGNIKKVDLNIRLPRFGPGQYRLRIYHNGQRIGKTLLSIS